MDTLLCDELLQEIFHRLRPRSLAAVSLVSKRWNRLLRSSTTSLSLYLPPPYDATTAASFSSFLSHHPFLTDLSVATSPLAGGGDNLLFSVAASCPKLRSLRYLTNPISPISLVVISTSCAHLSSISIALSRPLCFHWLRFFSGLKRLSLFFTNPILELDSYGVEEKIDAFDVEFSLVNLSLSGIVTEDRGLELLWRNCKNIRKLQLQSCASLGDYASVTGFVKILEGLQELELRACRSIVDGVLLKVAEHCVSLDTLLIYDGGSQEGLMQFIDHSKCNLKRLELRLPLDLDNSHLIALAENLNFRGLVRLRLESCCLVTGDGLKVLVRTIGIKLEEFALINCDVVERESGLLTALGQDLKRLRKLDLSFNEMMVDKELTLMLASCNSLIELRLRGCRGLTDKSVASMIRSCKNLQSVDITCCGIEMEGVELLVLNSKHLRQLEVEQSKLSCTARMISSTKSIEDRLSTGPIREGDAGERKHVQYEVKVLGAKSLQYELILSLPATRQSAEIDVSFEADEREATVKTAVDVVTLLFGLILTVTFLIYCLDKPDKSAPIVPSALQDWQHLSLLSEQSPRTPQPFIDFVQITLDETPYILQARLQEEDQSSKYILASME